MGAGMRTLFAFVLAMALAGCSSVSRDMAFGPGTAVAGAFPMIAVAGMVKNGSNSYTFTFRRVDLQTSTFQKEGFSLNFGAFGAIEGEEFKKPEEMQTEVRFGGRAAPAGDYALVVRVDQASYGMATTRSVNCFSLGSSVFRIKEGAVVVIPAGSVRGNVRMNGPEVVEQVKQILLGYPNIKGSVELVEPLGSLTFDAGDRCSVSGPFTFRPRGGAI